VKAIPAADQLIAASYATSQRFVAITKGEFLCFPDAGIVALPMVGGVGFFLPVHPRVYVAMVPQAVLAEEIQRTFETAGLASALSVGLVGDRVVVPPMRPDADRAITADILRAHRDSAQSLCRLFLQANEKIGITLANAFAPRQGGSGRGA
jgi:hypothetical protein